MPKRKKEIKKILIVFLSVLTAIVIFNVVFRSTNRSSVMVSNQSVDNKYNNRVLNFSDDLVQIDDKLYYQYVSNNFLKCGIYEISEYGSYKLKGGKVDHIYQFVNAIMYPTTINFFEHNGNIILNPDFKNIDKLETIDSTFKFQRKYCNVGSYIDNELIYTVDEYNGKLYFFTNSALYSYEDSNFNKIIDFPELISNSIEDITREHFYYFYNNTLYIPIKNEKTYDFYALNFDNKNPKIYSTNMTIERELLRFVIYDNYIIVYSPGDGVTSNSYVYKINLENNGTIEVLAKNTDGFNCFNDNIYTYVGYGSDNKGLYVINLHDKKTKRLYEGNVHSVYILDQEWIYFADDDHILYRISTNGSKLETVFDT